MSRSGDRGQDGIAEARPEAVIAHHRAEWRLERVAWGLMALLLLGALLGAFGGGPLSRASSGTAEAVELDYERLLRAAAPTEYRLRVQPGLAGDGRFTLRIDQSLLDMMQLESMVPEPESAVAGPGFTEFSFLVRPGRDVPARVVIRFQPSTFGRFDGALSVDGSRPLRVSHFVYP